MATKYASFLRTLRTEGGFSQEEIAKEIGVSRSSYINIEQGKKELSLTEASDLARVFGISIDELLNGKVDVAKIILETNNPKSKKNKEVKNPVPADRISVPQERVEKFKQVLLYILAKVGGKPNIGQTVLYKLLYFIDFDYYEKYDEQLIGARYIKNTHGPTPVIFPKIIKELEKEGKIEAIKSKFYKYDQTKYLINPNTQVNLSELSAQELAHIDWALDRLSDMTAVQISALSHIDTPWFVAKDKEQLEYEHAFYRREETSVGEYDPL